MSETQLDEVTRRKLTTLFETVHLLCSDMLAAGKLTPEQGRLWEMTRTAFVELVGYPITQIHGGEWDGISEIGKTIRRIPGAPTMVQTERCIRLNEALK
mgnify:FL=1